MKREDIERLSPGRIIEVGKEGNLAFHSGMEKAYMVDQIVKRLNQAYQPEEGQEPTRKQIENAKAMLDEIKAGDGFVDAGALMHVPIEDRVAVIIQRPEGLKSDRQTFAANGASIHCPFDRPILVPKWMVARGGPLRIAKTVEHEMKNTSRSGDVVADTTMVPLPPRQRFICETYDKDSPEYDEALANYNQGLQAQKEQIEAYS